LASLIGSHKKKKKILRRVALLPSFSGGGEIGKVEIIALIHKIEHSREVPTVN